jgi:hypothetical protein
MDTETPEKLLSKDFLECDKDCNDETDNDPYFKKRPQPWPLIITAIVGGIVIIYSSIAPNISNNLRIFSIILILLWTIKWCLILWVLWKENHIALSWWMLLFPIVMDILFLVLILILKLGIN